MLRHHVNVRDEFPEQQEQRGKTACSRAEQSPAAEELQWFCRVVQQKLDTNQIQYDGQRSRQAVIRFPASTRQILDGNLCNTCARPACQCGNEAMHLAIELQILDNFPPVRLECRSEVMEIQTTKLRHQPIRGTDGKPPRQPSIAPLEAPAADNIVAFLDFRNERRYLGRI